MKRTNTPSSKAEKEHLERLVEDLGPDVVRQLHRAFTLTAAAIYRRAVERAEAQLQERKTSESTRRHQESVPLG
jgi:hypothetical protein